MNAPQKAEVFNGADAEPDEFLRWPDGRINGMFEHAPRALEWFCAERLLAGRGHLLAGLGGSSKTQALYHFGVAAVTGALPWDWSVLITGSAALFLTEDTLTQVHRVMHRMGAHLDPDTRKLLVQRLRVFPLAGRQARLLELEGQRLLESRVYGWFMEQLDRLPKPLVFVGIDPALGISEGDELSQAHQRRLGTMIDHIAIESGACVVLNAHAAKGTSQADEPGSHTSRGAGAITDALRAEFVLRNMTAPEALAFGVTEREERRSFVQLAATKGNELPPGAYEPLWLKRTGDGLQQAALVAKRGPGERALSALEQLTAAAAQSEGGDVAMHAWRERCIAAGVVARGESRNEQRAMERIRDTLVRAGMVKKAAWGLWRPVSPERS